MGQLIAYNPIIASTLLIRLSYTNQYQDYLAAVYNAKFMTNVLEVFNTINLQIDLPQEFILIFIKKQIKECKI